MINFSCCCPPILFHASSSIPVTWLLYGIPSRYSPSKPSSAIFVEVPCLILLGSCPIAAATERSCLNISSGEIRPLLAASEIFFTTSLKSLSCALVSNTRTSAVGILLFTKSRSLIQALKTGGAACPLVRPR